MPLLKCKYVFICVYLKWEQTARDIKHKWQDEESSHYDISYENLGKILFAVEYCGEFLM